MNYILKRIGFLLCTLVFLAGCSVTIDSDDYSAKTPVSPENNAVETVDLESKVEAEVEAELVVPSDTQEESLEKEDTTIVSTEPTESSVSEVEKKEENSVPSAYISLNRTIQFEVKDDQGNEIYDVFTIAFIDPETGKQIRKFPRGNMLVFNNIAFGTYTISVSPVIQAGEVTSPYQNQSFDLTIDSDTPETKTIQIKAEKTVEEKKEGTILFEIRESEEAVSKKYKYMVDLGNNDTEEYYTRTTYTRGDTNLPLIEDVPSGSYHVRVYRQNPDVNNIWDTFSMLEIDFEAREIDTVIVIESK